MGCGASKGGKSAAKDNDPPKNRKGAAPEEDNKRKTSLDKVVSVAVGNEEATRSSKGSMRHWKKLSAAVTSGWYKEWEKYDLVFEGESEDYFEKFDEDQDDYKMFLKDHLDADGKKTRTDYAEANDVVNWSESLLEKLAKDKTARGQILRDAKAYGDQFDKIQDRHITVIYNPVGGGGKARRLVGAMVIPVLQLCKLKFKVMPTKYRRHAVELTSSLDVNSTNGLIVCGGDGLVHEVVTGHFLHPNKAELDDKVPIGICPCGTANAMANALHTHEDTSQISVVGRAALATCKGQHTKVDVIKCVQQPIKDSSDESLQGPDPIEIYALSCFGWGMAGAVALKADKLRWIPGQRSMRYDLAGFVSLVSDWPVADSCVLEYREAEPYSDEDPKPWQKAEIKLINLITTNMDTLGKGHPIYPGVEPDDGRLVLSYIDASKKMNNRKNVVKLGLAMKKGKHLGKGKGVVSYSLKEFKIKPTAFKSPFCIDGDPHDVSEVHVKCLPKALNLFYLPKDDVSGTGTLKKKGESLPDSDAEEQSPSPASDAESPPAPVTSSQEANAVTSN